MIKTIYAPFAALLNFIRTPSAYRSDYWKSLNASHELGGLPLPWMNYKTIQFLENRIQAKSRVFEYGSGSSTQFWLNKGCTVTSIEHDRAFFEGMRKHLQDRCDYRLIEPEPLSAGTTHAPESPDSFASSDFQGSSFEKYVAVIDGFEDGYFDMVVVDGRARPSCIKRSLPKIRSGGFLVLDNSDRAYYLSQTHDLLVNWPRKTFKGTVRGLLHQEETSIFQKP